MTLLQVAAQTSTTRAVSRTPSPATPSNRTCASVALAPRDLLFDEKDSAPAFVILEMSKNLLQGALVRC